MRLCRIAPSILSADFARLGQEVSDVVEGGADWIHFDVMDNHYVPNLTVGPLVLKAIRPYSKVPVDVHLMVEPVDELVPAFAKAGADIITFHCEASRHVDRTLQLIRDHGMKSGLVFNPATPLTYLDYELDRYEAETGRRIALEVDGGIKPANIAKVALAGADTFVAGSAVFGAGNAAGYADVISRMKAAVAALE